MALQVLNIGDLEREFRNRAARLYTPEAKEWLMTIPKNYLLNVDGSLDETDKRENLPSTTVAGSGSLWTGCRKFCRIGSSKPCNARSQFLSTIRSTTATCILEPKSRTDCELVQQQTGPEIDWNTLSFETALWRAGEWYQANGLR